MTKLTDELKWEVAEDVLKNDSSCAASARKHGLGASTVKDFISRINHKDFWEIYDDAESIESFPVHQDNIGLRGIVIPDTQVKAGTPINHIIAAGKWILESKPDFIVVIGDWWDMPSLNRFGSRLELDGKRVLEDMMVGKEAMLAFLDEFYGVDDYYPRMVFTVGNHDPQVRIPRVISEMPHLDGLLVDDTTEWLEKLGFEVYDFLDVVSIEGIRFSHYFQNPHSAKKAPLGGQIDTMLKNAGFSFIQGHTQGLKMGKHYLSDGTRRVGIVAGSFYQHSEDYMGLQGNEHWRGIIQLNEVHDGGCDICELSLNYLLRKFNL